MVTDVGRVVFDVGFVDFFVVGFEVAGQHLGPHIIWQSTICGCCVGIVTAPFGFSVLALPEAIPPASAGSEVGLFLDPPAFPELIPLFEGTAGALEGSDSAALLLPGDCVGGLLLPFFGLPDLPGAEDVSDDGLFVGCLGVALPIESGDFGLLCFVVG